MLAGCIINVHVYLCVHAVYNVPTEMVEQCGSVRVGRDTWLFSGLLSMFFIGIYLWLPSLCILSLVSLIMHSLRKEQVVASTGMPALNLA